MPALSFQEARQTVLDRVLSLRAPLPVEIVPLPEASGCVLAAPVHADRDYPPLPRSVRDGFALRAADTPGTLRIIGEVRAGGVFDKPLAPGQAVGIMTGAPVPPGAEAVVMIEQVTVTGDSVVVPRSVERGEHINARASECSAGTEVLRTGTRVDYRQAAMLASIGITQVPVFQTPRVAILSTGDEIVPLNVRPEPYQIRNSNAYSLAVQVARAGGEPDILPIAPDTVEETKQLVCEGLDEHDLLLISGGVSAGKYDVVETVLSQLGAEFYFDRVLIQPGQPCVFGRVQDTFFFGLPGNPASSMVCFEIFARAALELIGGQNESDLPILEVELAQDFRQKPGLTRFLPALLSSDGCTLTPVRWSGSSDIYALSRSNAYLVTHPDRTAYRKGEKIGVLLR